MSVSWSLPIRNPFNENASLAFKFQIVTIIIRHVQIVGHKELTSFSNDSIRNNWVDILKWGSELSIVFEHLQLDGNWSCPIRVSNNPLKILESDIGVFKRSIWVEVEFFREIVTDKTQIFKKFSVEMFFNPKSFIYLAIKVGQIDDNSSNRYSKTCLKCYQEPEMY